MRLCILTLLIGSLAGGLLMAQGAAPTAAQNCCPNCQMATGGCYRDVVTQRCRMVPDNKPIKKTVYEYKDVPYCLHCLPGVLKESCCAQCEACPRYKRVLVKKEVVCGEKCGTKCVVEDVVQRVPVPCCHCGYRPDTGIAGP